VLVGEREVRAQELEHEAIAVAESVDVDGSIDGTYVGCNGSR
jgi:hypothetical protein